MANQLVTLNPAQTQRHAAMKADVVGDGDSLRRSVDDQVLVEQGGGNGLVANVFDQGDGMPKVGEETPIRLSEGELRWRVPLVRLRDGKQGLLLRNRVHASVKVSLRLTRAIKIGS
jgi:hypothetical protein